MFALKSVSPAFPLSRGRFVGKARFAFAAMVAGQVGADRVGRPSNAKEAESTDRMRVGRQGLQLAFSSFSGHTDQKVGQLKRFRRCRRLPLLLVMELPLPTLLLPLSRWTDERPVLIVYSGSMRRSGRNSGVVQFGYMVRIPYLLVTEQPDVNDADRRFRRLLPGRNDGGTAIVLVFGLMALLVAGIDDDGRGSGCPEGMEVVPAVDDVSCPPLLLPPRVFRTRR